MKENSVKTTVHAMSRMRSLSGIPQHLTYSRDISLNRSKERRTRWRNVRKFIGIPRNNNAQARRYSNLKEFIDKPMKGSPNRVTRRKSTNVNFSIKKTNDKKALQRRKSFKPFQALSRLFSRRSTGKSMRKRIQTTRFCEATFVKEWGRRSEVKIGDGISIVDLGPLDAE